MNISLSTTNNNIALFQDGSSSVQNNSDNNNEIKMFEQDEDGKLRMTDAGKIALIIEGICIVGECLNAENDKNEDEEILDELNEGLKEQEEPEESTDTSENKMSFGEIVIGILLAWVANIAHKMEDEK